jgi:hypothetical protein
MGRVINPDSSGKRRNQLMRSGAEILRRLGEKQTVDDEARDLTAALVYIFREIDEGIESSAEAWEKRDYWVKAEELRRRWAWPGGFADQLQDIVYTDAWHNIPVTMMRLLPYFSEIKITKLTRKESEWEGSYLRLMSEKPAADSLPTTRVTKRLKPANPPSGD